MSVLTVEINNTLGLPGIIVKNTKFHLISWCGGFVERHSLNIVLGDFPNICGNCAFPQTFHPRKFGEIMLFFVVHGSIWTNNRQKYRFF